ncbi:class F sortase [Actinomycetospora sp. TBRC 11914]|uniref:class F sortase n=1 Tax=Actinomycetospora sp. TBRC 11914 TaxID=2729387 RepID=UPI00145C4263|nr:class F sortase [Actinomycetospora sp. TBRC 11914]NMO90302.1 class F sortase [Actinomycetospora sp. TBRC 11914]
MARERHGRTAWWLSSGAIVLGLILVVWGFGWALHAALVAADGDRAALPPSVPETPRAVTPLPGAPRVLGRPVVLAIPALGVRAPVDPVDAPDGDLRVPDDPDRVGWWREGAVPGADTGTALIAGHVDSAVSGPGALFWLDRLQPGDPVTVTTTSGEADYVVVSVRRYPKADLPGSVATSAGPAGLTLVTCGGPFDHAAHSYRDNVVVDAVPPIRAAAPRPPSSMPSQPP